MELGKAKTMRSGSDVTLVGWGGQLHVMSKACDMAAKEGEEKINLAGLLWRT